MLDSYIGPARVRELKPYGYSAWHGEDFLREHRGARTAWTALLRERGASLERFPVIGEACAVPDDPRRRQDLDRWLQRQADEALAEGPLDAGAWSERIVRAHLDARLPLGEDPIAHWCFQTVQRWVERFEAHGCVHRLYDAQGHRVAREPNRTDVLVRLALAAAWASVSTRDAAHAVMLTNAVLKILDLVQAQTAHGGVDLSQDDADFALAAVTLETCAVDRIAERAGRMTREEAA